MTWGKDSEKNNDSWEFEKFDYCPHKEFSFFRMVYDKAMGQLDSEESKVMAFKAFRQAAKLGDLSVILALKFNEWTYHRYCNLDNFGLAVELRPYVDKGNKLLDYYFGRALINGSRYHSKSYFEGLFWIEKSCGISVLYPKENQPFELFVRNYMRYEEGRYGHSSCEHDGLVNVSLYNKGGFLVLARSKEAWEDFKKKKLTNVETAPLSSYLYTFDEEQIRFQIKNFNIKFDYENSLVKGLVEKEYIIETLHIFSDVIELGNISIRPDNNEICQSFTNQEIPELIRTIEEMLKVAHVGEVNSWLAHIANK